MPHGIRCITASVLSDLIIHARYCRRIPALTETAARQGDSSARVCGNNQKRCTPGFYRVYGSRVCLSCSPVLCGGGRNRTLTQILVGTMLCLSGLSRCHSCKALYQTFVRAVRLTGPPGGVACHGAGASRKKTSFCISMAAAACLVIY